MLQLHRIFGALRPGALLRVCWDVLSLPGLCSAAGAAVPRSRYPHRYCESPQWDAQQ